MIKWTTITQQLVDINYSKTKGGSFHFSPGGHIDVILAIVEIKLKRESLTYAKTNNL